MYWFQHIIRVKSLAIELGRTDIIFVMLSQCQAVLKKGHQEAWYLLHTIYQKLASKKVFDLNVSDIDESRLDLYAEWKEFYSNVEDYNFKPFYELICNHIMASAFLDTDHAGTVVTMWLLTGILTFEYDALIVVFRKRQSTVESSTYESKLDAKRRH